MPNYVPGIGPVGHSNLMIIGEAPGRFEDQAGIPFVGPSGEMLNEDLALAKISRSECYITNVVKLQPPANDFSKLASIGVSLEESISILWEEIRRVNPNCILAVGREALRAVTGITASDSNREGEKQYAGILNYRGSILLAKDGKTKVVPTIHPAALFSHSSREGLPYVYRQLIRHDIQRAVDESIEAVYRPPSRSLDIARNSLGLFRFLESYRKLEKCSVDIESINSIPVCIGFAFSAHHAISVPLIRNIGPIKFTEMGMRDHIDCIRMIDQTLRRVKIIGTNFKYDDFKLGLFRFECPDVYSDTLIKTRVLFPELPTKGLATQASIWTREPYYKEEGKEFKLGKSSLDQLFLYNAKDCAVNFEVDEAQELDLISMQDTYAVPLVSYYHDYMMRKHKLYLEMEQNGFCVDLNRQKELKKKYTELQFNQHTKLVSLVGHEVNVKSPPQKADLFKELGLPLYSKAPTSEDAIVKMLGNHCKGKNGDKKRAILEGILEETRIRDQKSRYINFTPDYDGRCKSGFNIIATETCRSSTSVLKKPVRPEKIGLAFHTISKHGRLAKDIRSMFVPDKGKVFLQVDSSQAEARVVAVLSKDYELLRAFDTIDIHRRTAALVLGMSTSLDLNIGTHVSDKIGKDSAERFVGKKTRHAGNYDMKKARFMAEFNTDAQKFEINASISEWKAGSMLDSFHRASPKIRNTFHREIQEAISNTRVLIDPMGGVRVFNGVMNESLFQEGYANIPQRTVSHLVQGALIKIHDDFGDQIGPVKTHPINLISENHDSLLFQLPENMIDECIPVIQKHMTTPIDFSKYCTLKRDYILTIPCDIEVSDTTYGELDKLSKFKAKTKQDLILPTKSLFERMQELRG